MMVVESVLYLVVVVSKALKLEMGGSNILRWVL